MEDMIMYQKNKHDMTAFGQAVKEARERKGLSREKLAEMLDLSPRYLMYIETRGQHPSLQKLYDIATLFNISIDQFFFTDTSESRTTHRRQLDAMLDGMDEKELSVITATVKAMQEAKEAGEK
jgi:transcriptional regulator with XRE-family HTH domain